MYVLLLLLLIMSLGGGYWGYSRYGVRGGIGPVGVFTLLILILYFTGNLPT